MLRIKVVDEKVIIEKEEGEKKEEKDKKNDPKINTKEETRKDDEEYKLYKPLLQTKGETICRMINFADGVAWEIFDEELIKNLQWHLMKYFQLPSNFKKFPGALPVALTKNNSFILKSKKNLNERCDYEHKIFLPPNGIRKRFNTMNHFLQAKNSKNSFYVTRKSNGTRYMLMFDFRDYAKSKDVYQTLWSRKLRPVLVKFEVPDYLHEDTLIDGELVIEPDGTHVFYCFDLILVNGRNMCSNRLMDRQKCLAELVQQIRPSADKQSPFLIRIKRFMPVSKLLEFLKLENLEYLNVDSTIKNVNMAMDIDHPCDGLIFIENDAPIIVGTAHRQLKWKLPLFCTIDFLIQFPLLNDDNQSQNANQNNIINTCDLFISDENGLKFWKSQSTTHTFTMRDNKNKNENQNDQLICMTTNSNSDYITSTYNNINVNFQDINDELISIAQKYHNKIIECFYNWETNNWKFKLVREDKTIPNYIETVKETIDSLKDNITIANLLSIINQ